MASIITFFLLFLLPFVIAPFGVTQFENPKVIFGELGIILLLLACLFTNHISFHHRAKQFVFYFSIFLVTVIDLLFFRTSISFFGNAFRMQGVFLLWMLLLFSFISSRQVSGQDQGIASVAFSDFAMTGPWWVYAGLLYLELIVTFFFAAEC